MKQNGFWKGFGSGLVLTVLIAALCVTATATSKRSIQVEDGIGITLNGARFTPRDAAGKQVPVFLYNGTTYVPVRAISEAMGMDVSFNSATRTVQLTTADRTASQQGASSASGNYISADRAKQIALNDAGVKEANAVFLRANLDWDDGQWMREWCSRCEAAGANLYDEAGLIANDSPNEEAREACRELGRKLAAW